MKLKLFCYALSIGLAISVFSPTLTSCTNVSSKNVDSMAIYTKYVKDHPDLVEKSGARSLKFMANSKPEPLPHNEQR